jgi:hypothetical protein
MTSHPFVVGYRGGRYRELWGGSPVHAPILEVELGDLDGDGLEELAAIEAPIDDSARYVTVWRWHGWGFSLVWRSPPGEYHDLILLPAEKEKPARLSVSLCCRDLVGEETEKVERPDHSQMILWAERP